MAQQNIFSFFHEQLCISSYMELVQKKMSQIKTLPSGEFHISQKAADHLWHMFDGAAPDIIARGHDLTTKPPKVARGTLPTMEQASSMLEICIQWLKLLVDEAAVSRDILSSKEMCSRLLLIENDIIDHSLKKTIA